MTDSWTSAALDEFATHWPIVWNAAALPALACAGTLIIAHAARRQPATTSCESGGRGTFSIVDGIAFTALATWMILRLQIIPDFETWSFPPRHSIAAFTAVLAVAGACTVVSCAFESHADGSRARQRSRARTVSIGIMLVALAALAQPNEWNTAQHIVARAALVGVGVTVWSMMETTARREPGLTLAALALTWLAAAAWADFAGPAPSLSIIATGFGIALAMLIPFGRCGGVYRMASGARAFLAAALVAVIWTTWFGARPGGDLHWAAMLPLAAPLLTLLVLQRCPGPVGSKSRRGVTIRMVGVVLAASASVLWPALLR